MHRRSLIILGLLIATISAYGTPRFERSIIPREQTPKSIITEEGEEVCGDVAEADHIVISKERMCLELYDNNDQLICSFPVSLGKNYGNKQDAKRHITPN